MNVALCWAPPINPPGSAAQAVRGHTSGLTAANHDVTLYYGDRLNALPETDHDALIWPSNLYNTHQIKTNDVNCHRHVHLIGVDDPGNAVAFQEMLDLADSLSAVDPNAALYFADRFDLGLSDIRVIPNPPNRDLFPEQDPAPDGYVFAPKTGAAQKEGHGLAGVAERTPNQTYETHAADRSKLPWLPFNVHVDPPVPWALMPERYSGCAFVCNAARHEGLPNVAYEAFCSGRAYVSRKEAVGRVQSLDINDVDVSDFGASADWFQDEYANDYYWGNHYIHAEPEQLPVKVKELAGDPGELERVGRAARKWVDALDWSWPDAARAIVEAIEG